MSVTLSLEIIVQAECTVAALETTLAEFLVLSWSFALNLDLASSKPYVLPTVCLVHAF